MEINITVLGKYELPKNAAEHIEKKLTKLNKFFSEDTVAQVKVYEVKLGVSIEVTVYYKDMIFRAERTAPKLYPALDSIEDILERQIRKNKTRLERRLKEGAFAGGFETPVEEEKDFDVLRVKKFSPKPLNVDEAILQMNLLDHTFFVFHNAETDKVNVVYRRNDGGYGLLEPNV
ncbi:MAG: ribosome-associated translation inhibitor RaiA [Bacillota bacterium]|nr:ribosome-associated translation inhibitor RaiA [Bacillota bacterium]